VLACYCEEGSWDAFVVVSQARLLEPLTTSERNRENIGRENKEGVGKRDNKSRICNTKIPKKKIFKHKFENTHDQNK
jgi:hypothetical protein